MSIEATAAFGQVVQQTRKQLGMSQADLAFASGLDRTFISRLETGKMPPSLTTIFALAQALNESPSTLLRRVESHLQ